MISGSEVYSYSVSCHSEFRFLLLFASVLSFLIHIVFMHWKSSDQVTLQQSFCKWDLGNYRKCWQIPIPGMDLEGAKYCSTSTVAPSSQSGVGAAHAAQVADGLTQSQPAAAPQSPRKLFECETKKKKVCQRVHRHRNKYPALTKFDGKDSQTI